MTGCNELNQPAIKLLT